MKYIIYIFGLGLLYSCENKTSKLAENSSETTNQQTADIDSILTFYFNTNFTNKNIENNSDSKIDLLFNGVTGYLEGYKDPDVSFNTECMSCQPVQEFNGGILFGKQLLITKDSIRYYKNTFDLPDSLNRINTISNAERKNLKFNFQQGNGNVSYIGMSCNDADFYKILLTYPTGQIIVDSLINASLFEYDLNKDGQKEQFLMGMRNCTQELVILRTRQ